jgi:hypothetical protein
MNDALNYFGAIALATKDTDVYSADKLDFQLPATRSRFTRNQTGEQEAINVVFIGMTNDQNAADSFIPFLQDSADDSTYNTILTGPQTALGLKKGVQAILPFPKSHRRYVRAGVTPKSSGTLTANSVQVGIEFGSNSPNL